MTVFVLWFSGLVIGHFPNCKGGSKMIFSSEMEAAEVIKQRIGVTENGKMTN